jgi:hypothetical protein
MKTIKLFLIILFLISSSGLLYSQIDEGNPPPTGTIRLVNNSSSIDCSAQIIPVSMIMNGNGEYNLYAKPVNQVNDNTIKFNYLGSVYILNNTRCTTNVISHGGNSWELWFDANYNPVPTQPRPYGIIGRGIYKILFKWWDLVQNKYVYDTTLLELDGADVSTYYALPFWTFTFVDHTDNYGGPGGMGITYQGYYPDNTLGPQWWVGLVGHYIRCWDPYKNSILRRNKEFGDFTYSTNYGNNFNVIPQDAREDCWNPPIPNQDHYYIIDNEVEPGNVGNVENGNLSLKLTISKNVGTLTDAYKWVDLCSEGVMQPLYLNILDQSTLTLSQGAYLYINAGPYMYPGCSYGRLSFQMTDKTGGILVLNSGSKIILNYNGSETNTELLLDYNSHYTGSGDAEIRLYPGAIFCNNGAIISGSLRLHYMGRRVGYSPCLNDFVNKNTQFILDSSSVEIPDNTTIILDGNSSSMILNPSSELIFGQNSKLVFQNGAHLVAHNSSFTSTDQNSTWDGIYLSGLSNDTITNCTITNALNGINITDKNSLSQQNQPSTEISNCTFIDSSNTQLNNGIYISNSYNVLVKHNSFSSSPVIEGFASAILMQYCPSGNIDILDNTIGNVTTGISVIQTSPYIARNTINGQTGDGSGINLDNSNGTVKYNIINNFVNAIKQSYSSPYILKNTLNNASDINVNLIVNSVPIMNPIKSGGALNWLGGNNFINGTPATSGIAFTDGAYPSVDSGFNNFNLHTSNYFSGTLSYSVLMATYNYWTDRPAIQSKFNVSNGSVYARPDYDGSTLPPTNGFRLNDIGFGLYDTVYTESLSDNPLADNLFMQAYNNEMTGQYLTAITLYKQVATNYRTSNLAPAAISRIINCLEKKISTNTEYSQLQTYMSQVMANNLIPHAVKELAEDFVIKTLVRQNLLQNSISNYDSMYQHNIGNNKGVHALVNKLSLLSMYQDTSHHNFNLQQNYKLALLSLITGKQLAPMHVTQNTELPNEFRLYQNYPNPFNPTTTIKYDLPKEGVVSIKIYDIAGKEIYTMSEFKIAGSYEMTFDGSRYASGVYFYRINAGNYTSVKKMVLVK